MFTRPDTGSVPVSYPAPTKSALKGISECVVMSYRSYFEPQRIEICSPIVFHKYTINYGGPLKKSGTGNFQQFATILENVCYKVYGIIRSYEAPKHLINPQHAMQEMFERRLAAGQFYSTPFLGWKEMAPCYFGPLRDETQVDVTINITIPSMLSEMYTKPTNGRVDPFYEQNVRIEKGVMRYAERII